MVYIVLKYLHRRHIIKEVSFLMWRGVPRIRIRPKAPLIGYIQREILLLSKTESKEVGKC